MVKIVLDFIPANVTSISEIVQAFELYAAVVFEVVLVKIALNVFELLLLLIKQNIIVLILHIKIEFVRQFFVVVVLLLLFDVLF